MEAQKQPPPVTTAAVAQTVAPPTITIRLEPVRRIRHVTWDETTAIDNEFLGKKSSKSTACNIMIKAKFF
jgi:hypothetical protein